MFSSLHNGKFLKYQKILFLSKVMLVLLPAPIYKRLYVRDDIQIWVLASTRALLKKQKPIVLIIT